MERADRAVAGLAVSSRVLDIGAGPGHHGARWAAAGFRAVVVDPSPRMVAMAARPGVGAVQATAQRLPFRDGVFRLAYFHLSLHYGDWRTALDEAQRVLEPGGRCDIWTLGPPHHARSMLSRWFPSVRPLDEQRFPDPRDVVLHLERAGMTVSHSRETETVNRTAGEWADAVRAGFVSTLQLVDARELREGLAAFRAAYPDREHPIAYEMRWEWIRGVKPDGYAGPATARSGNAG